MSDLLHFESLDFSKKVEELQEKTRTQEDLHEKEVKTMKKSILMAKAQVFESQKIFAERIKDLQDKYLTKIQTEQNLSQSLLFGLRENFRQAEEEKQRKIDERSKVFKASEKIKESLNDELEHLRSQKKKAEGHLLEVSSKITQIQEVQKASLLKHLKKLQKTQGKEVQDLNFRVSQEKTDFLNLTSSKTDLLHKLQLNLAGLQDELKHSKQASSSKLTTLKTHLQSVRHELKDTEFKINQVLSNSQGRDKVDQVVLGKSKLLDSLHEANRDLWSRYEKLNKLIF